MDAEKALQDEIAGLEQIIMSERAWWWILESDGYGGDWISGEESELPLR